MIDNLNRRLALRTVGFLEALGPILQALPPTESLGDLGAGILGNQALGLAHDLRAALPNDWFQAPVTETPRPRAIQGEHWYRFEDNDIPVTIAGPPGFRPDVLVQEFAIQMPPGFRLVHPGEFEYYERYLAIHQKSEHCTVLKCVFPAGAVPPPYQPKARNPQ